MSIRNQFVKARELIQNEQYAEARAILNAIDHSQAQDWLKRLDALEARKAKQATSNAPVAKTSNQETASPAQSTISEDGLWLIPLRGFSGEKGSIAIGSKKINITAVIITLIVSLIGGVVAGLGLMYSSWYVYLYIFQPILAALVAALFVWGAVKLTKLRHGRSAFFIGLLVALVLYGTYRVGNYIDFRRIVYEEVQTFEPNITNAEFNAGFNELMREETGFSGFLGYVHLEAIEGLSVSFRSRSGVSSGELFRTNVFFTYVYWLVEIIIIIATLVLTATDTSSKPYCVKSGKWLDFTLAGYIPREQLNAFMNALNQGDVNTIGQYLTNNSSSSIRVNVAMCDRQAGEGLIHILYQEGRDTKNILEPAIISGRVTERLLLASDNLF
ncbi:MAG: hypothetical protein AAF846_09380 [Chloroflexota bacterium]